MDYRIEAAQGALVITVEQVGEARDALLALFSACRDGRCQCPTDEYGKLASMQVEESGGDVVLRLVPASGVQLDQAAIERCLDWTTGRASAAP